MEETKVNSDAPKKILAVDDEPEIVTLLKVGLHTRGFLVVTATNGREAVEMARAEQPDLIVMDVMMPEMDGFQALRQLKEDESTARIPIIMLTAKAAEADVLNGWLRGADLYVTKPFDPIELIENIRSVLADAAQDNAEFLDEA